MKHMNGKQATTNMGWLQNHLETFVKPVIGQIPTLPDGYKPVFSSQEMAVIKAMWKAVKRESVRLKLPILLAGRDVFIFEILARRENFPTVFRPDISRNTVSHVKEDYSNHFLFDTGFAGSIPKALKSKSYILGSSDDAPSMSPVFSYSVRRASLHRPLDRDVKQVFPRMKGARSLILKIERTPKYWKRAYHRSSIYGKWNPNKFDAANNLMGAYDPPTPEQLEKVDPVTGIGQDLTTIDQFTAAALLTIEIYTNKAPAFIPTPVDVVSHSQGGWYVSGND